MALILFNYEIDFQLKNEHQYKEWIDKWICKHGFSTGEINYIFCDDSYLHKINVEFLNHDSLTDIISFDYSTGDYISGDIFISIERVRENAKDFRVSFKKELQRVIIHGILHYMGYKDKSDIDKKIMRTKENEAIAFF